MGIISDRYVQRYILDDHYRDRDPEGEWVLYADYEYALRKEYERGFKDGHACAYHDGTECLEDALKEQAQKPKNGGAQ